MRLLRLAVARGIDLERLTLFHLLAGPRANENASERVLQRQLEKLGLNHDDAALLAVSVRSTGHAG